MKAVAVILLIANMVFFAWQYPQQGMVNSGHSVGESVVPVLAGNEAPAPSLVMLKELPPSVAAKIVTVYTDPPPVTAPPAVLAGM